MKPIASLWLDDMRPAPDGWLHVFTVKQAIDAMNEYTVERASLDHDLGACEKCMGGKTAEQWLEEAAYQSMPNCEHFGSGYDFVCWMERNNIWPAAKPKVHSANPAGRARMQAAIDRHFR